MPIPSGHFAKYAGVLSSNVDSPWDYLRALAGGRVAAAYEAPGSLGSRMNRASQAALLAREAHGPGRVLGGMLGGGALAGLAAAGGHPLPILHGLAGGVLGARTGGHAASLGSNVASIREARAARLALEAEEQAAREAQARAAEAAAELMAKAQRNKALLKGLGGAGLAAGGLYGLSQLLGGE
jgi:hypothetical protein